MGDEFFVGELAVDVFLNQIRRTDGTAVGVEPRSMEVLVYLAEHANAVCSRQQILDGVWGDDAFVGEEALSHCIWDLRRALGDDARKPKFIQTLPRRGYRLLSAVTRPGDLGQGERYRLVEEVGAGAMGVVWKARDRRLERDVALKFLPIQWCREPQAKERFLREAKVTAALDHANVCTLYEIDETDDGRLFLVMPFYGGRTLDQVLSEGPLPWRRAATLAADIGRGLAAAHRQDIVHRDVKPANLMVQPDDAVKVLDFGVARFRHHATELTGTSFSPGTPAYKSPEQTLGDAIDGRSDVWSLAVVLYEMISGRLPFAGDYEQAIMHGILERRPAALESLPAPTALREVIERALNKDPDERFASMDDMVAALEGALQSVAASVDAPEAADPEVASAERVPSASPPGDPTAVEADAGASAAAISPTISPNHPPNVRRTSVRPRRPWMVAALVALVVWFGWMMWRHLAAATPALRVAVLEPQVEGDSPELHTIASGVLVTTLNSLAARHGLAAVDSIELAGATSASEAARATAADEIVAATVEPNGVMCRVTLRRLAPDGRVLWADMFEVPGDLYPGRILADAVNSKLDKGFPKHRPRYPGGSVFRDDDYRIYLDIQRRLAAGASVTTEDLNTLSAVLEASPKFVEAYLFAADLAWRLGRSQRNPELFEKGLAWVEEAEALAGADARSWAIRLRIALAGQQTEAAETALERLRVLIPGEVSLVEAESSLLEQQGDLQGALRARRRAVELRPSWILLYRLGNLEYRMGEVDSARRHLELALERSPDNRRCLSKLAELEMLYGDLQRAESLYGRLLKRSSQVNYLTNLGVVYVLLGDAARAADTYRQALLRAPDHPLILINLAEAEAMQGRQESAEAIYRQVLEQLQRNAEDGPLGPIDGMMQAVCWARLGDARSAVRKTQEVLRDHAENAEVTYQASVVYALTGDVNAALVNVERALELGIQGRWFEMPAFDGLAESEGFRHLVTDSTGADRSTARGQGGAPP